MELPSLIWVDGAKAVPRMQKYKAQDSLMHHTCQLLGFEAWKCLQHWKTILNCGPRICSYLKILIMAKVKLKWLEAMGCVLGTMESISKNSIHTSDSPQVMLPIYFQGNSNRYGEQNNIVGIFSRKTLISIISV